MIVTVAALLVVTFIWGMAAALLMVTVIPGLLIMTVPARIAAAAIAFAKTAVCAVVIATISAFDAELSTSSKAVAAVKSAWCRANMAMQSAAWAEAIAAAAGAGAEASATATAAARALTWTAHAASWPVV